MSPTSSLCWSGVFFFGGLTLAVVAQVLWSRRRNSRGFPVELPDRDP